MNESHGRWRLRGAIVGATAWAIVVWPADTFADRATLDADLQQIDTREEQGDFSGALRELMTVLEEHPDESWDRNLYRSALYWAWGCFTELPGDERIQFLSDYGGTPPGCGDGAAPPLSNLLEWMRDFVPTTSLTSHRARLVLGIWHHLEGNDAAFLGYGMGAVQAEPNSIAAEYAIIYMLGVQHYSAKLDGMLDITRACAEVAPNNRGTGWSIFRCVMSFLVTSKVNEARQFLTEMIAAAPDTLAGNVAQQLMLLMNDAEARNYASVLDRYRQLAGFAPPNPMRNVIDALLHRVDWRQDAVRRRNDPHMQGMIQAAQAEADAYPDSERGALAHAILGRCYQRCAHAGRALQAYEEAIRHGSDDVKQMCTLEASRCCQRDRKRAIALLEQHCASVDNDPAAEIAMKQLAGYYLQDKRFQEALDLLLVIESRCESGFAVVDVRGEQMRAMIAACLEGLGYEEQAQAMMDSLLGPSKYKAPLDELTNADLVRLLQVLRWMGRDGDAYRAQEEYLNRIKRRD